MTEPQAQPPSAQPSAGALLRAARERSGVHIGVLSTTLKVPVRKLELLENDRFDELHDATFVRALAMSVCRVLKCDPEPVMQALPRIELRPMALEPTSSGGAASLPGLGDAPVVLRSSADRSARWRAGMLVAVLAGGVWWVTASWMPGSLGTAAVADAISAASVGSAASTAAAAADAAQPGAQAASQALATDPSTATAAMVQTVHGAPATPDSASAAGLESTISVTEPSWVEALDLQGRQIWARMLTPGEVVSLDKGPGWRLTIGNAAGTQVRWRGREVDLSTSTRDNVARVELK